MGLKPKRFHQARLFGVAAWASEAPSTHPRWHASALQQARGNRGDCAWQIHCCAAPCFCVLACATIHCAVRPLLHQDAQLLLAQCCWPIAARPFTRPNLTHPLWRAEQVWQVAQAEGLPSKRFTKKMLQQLKTAGLVATKPAGGHVAGRKQGTRNFVYSLKEVQQRQRQARLQARGEGGSRSSLGLAAP